MKEKNTTTTPFVYITLSLDRHTTAMVLQRGDLAME